MNTRIIRVMLLVLTLMPSAVKAIYAEGIPSATLSVSCTIPEVPGLNAPLPEKTSNNQISQETADKTTLAVSQEDSGSLTPQDDMLLEDSNNNNTVLKTAYKR